jgi:hypothetical protein
MTIVLEYRSGRVEIVSFQYDDSYPNGIRLRRPAGKDENDQVRYGEMLFLLQRWMRHGKPVYVEAMEPPEEAA